MIFRIIVILTRMKRKECDINLFCWHIFFRIFEETLQRLQVPYLLYWSWGLNWLFPLNSCKEYPLECLRIINGMKKCGQVTYAKQLQAALKEEGVDF